MHNTTYITRIFEQKMKLNYYYIVYITTLYCMICVFVYIYVCMYYISIP